MKSLEKEYIAYQLGICILGTTFTILGIGLSTKLTTSAAALSASVTLPFIPYFIITAFSYFIPLSFLVSGVCFFVPFMRNFAYYLASFILTLIALSTLFLTRGPNFEAFALCFLPIIVLMLTAYMDPLEQ